MENDSDNNNKTATAMLQLDTNTDNESNSSLRLVHPGEILQKEVNLVKIIDETKAFCINMKSLTPTQTTNTTKISWTKEILMNLLIICN